MKHAVRLLLIALAVAVSSAAGAARAASFDCGKAHTPDERAICATRDLNDQDVRMATMFHMLRGMRAMGVTGSMGERQRAWLAERRRCGADRRCIASAYATRLRELQANYDSLPRPL